MRLKRVPARLRLGKRQSRGGLDAEERRQNNENAGATANNEVADEYNGGAEGSSGEAGSVHLSESTISSNNDPDDSEVSEDDMTDLVLPPGYLAFLSGQQSEIDDELSTIADQLRGNGKHSSPLLQIHVVREFVYDRGAILIARAMEEGCSSCPNHCLNTQQSIISIQSISTRDILPTYPSPPCHCPSHLRDIVLSRCHIGDDGACALAHAISRSRAALKTLDLSSNNITGVGVTCLANCTVMQHGPNDSCDLGSCGGSACSIETLVLSSNPILSVGALALASALRGQCSVCPHHHKGLSDSAVVSITSNYDAAGFCSLKNLHVSGCQLNDEDAMMLGNSLLPHCSHSNSTKFNDMVADPDEGVEIVLPSLPRTNNLMLLNLHGNCITVRGMEFLYSVIHNCSPLPARNEISDNSELRCLQSLYCQSNHTIELGVIVDHGTRDYNYGNFFDQEEDEQLLMNMRNYKMTGSQSTVDIEQFLQKWLLKEKMMHDLRINRHCALALEDISVSTVPSNQSSIHMQSLATPKETRQQILCAGAWKKITQVLTEKLHPSPITLPRRQDEYGKHLDEDHFLGLGHLQYASPEAPTIGNYFANLDLNMFPHFFYWINQNCHHPTKLAIVFDILCENPDVCGFHSIDMGKRPDTGN